MIDFDEILSCVFDVAKSIFPILLACVIFRISLRVLFSYLRGDAILFCHEHTSEEAPRPKVSLKKDIPQEDLCSMPSFNTDFIQLN